MLNLFPNKYYVLFLNSLLLIILLYQFKKKKNRKNIYIDNLKNLLYLFLTLLLSQNKNNLFVKYHCCFKMKIFLFLKFAFVYF